MAVARPQMVKVSLSLGWLGRLIPPCLADGVGYGLCGSGWIVGSAARATRETSVSWSSSWATTTLQPAKRMTGRAW